MQQDTTPAVGERYAVAYKTQYGAKDMQVALDLYKAIIAEHPDTQEAGYSRSQIGNIVKAVVPKQELIDAQLALVSACLARNISLDATPDQVTA